MPVAIILRDLSVHLSIEENGLVSTVFLDGSRVLSFHSRFQKLSIKEMPYNMVVIAQWKDRFKVLGRQDYVLLDNPISDLPTICIYATEPGPVLALDSLDDTGLVLQLGLVPTD